MKASVILTDESINYTDQVDIDYIDNKYCFNYVDNQNNVCDMRIYDDGICLLRKGIDHTLQLNLRKKACAIITTSEGSIEIDTKVVDFIENDDILVMRYVVDNIERQIKIVYRS